MKPQALGTSLVMLLGVLIGCGGGGGSAGTGSSGAASPAVPAVFWVSQPVEPDETMLITGGNLGAAAQVELAQLPDGDPGSPVASLLPDLAWTKLPVSAATSRSVSAAVPATATSGVYGLRLSNGTALGQVRLVDAPDPWFVQGDQGDTAQPGGTFLVGGTCLERPGGVAPQADLVQNGLKFHIDFRDRCSRGVGLDPFAIAYCRH
jgi:hypothetical protein